MAGAVPDGMLSSKLAYAPAHVLPMPAMSSAT
jgi:hypothetical protein